MGPDTDHGVPRMSHRVHRGSGVIVSIWRLHRNPKYWSDPDVFDPDRWCACNRSRLINAVRA